MTKKTAAPGPGPGGKGLRQSLGWGGTMGSQARRFACCGGPVWWEVGVCSGKEWGWNLEAVLRDRVLERWGAASESCRAGGELTAFKSRVSRTT